MRGGCSISRHFKQFLAAAICRFSDRSPERHPELYIRRCGGVGSNMAADVATCAGRGTSGLQHAAASRVWRRFQAWPGKLYFPCKLFSACCSHGHHAMHAAEAHGTSPVGTQPAPVYRGTCLQLLASVDSTGLRCRYLTRYVESGIGESTSTGVLCELLRHLSIPEAASCCSVYLERCKLKLAVVSIRLESRHSKVVRHHDDTVCMRQRDTLC